MEELVQHRRRRSRLFRLAENQYSLTIGPYAHAVTQNMADVDTNLQAENSQDVETSLNYGYRNDPAKTDINVFLGQTPGEVVMRNKVNGRAIRITPQEARVAPEFNVSNARLMITSLWAGIDVIMFITDYGFKTGYRITGPLGQRIVRYDIAGDIANFRIGRTSYQVDGKTFIAPSNLNAGVLSLDFRGVPVGTIVDPTFGPASGVNTDGEVRHSPAAATWAEMVAAAAADEYALPDGDAISVYVDYNGGAPYLSRGYILFDTSTIPANATISSATVGLDSGAAASGPGVADAGVYVCASTWTVPLGLADYSAVGGQVSDVMFKPTSASQAQAFALTVGGLTSITKEGTSLFSIRHTQDLNVVQPSGWSLVTILTANYAVVAQRPRLTVVYTASSATGGNPDFPFSKGGQNQPFRWR